MYKRQFKTPTTIKVGDREVVKNKSFTRVATNLATASTGFADDVPAFNPVSYTHLDVYKRQDPPTCALRPVNPNNASPLRITAAAGTKLAGAYSPGTVIIFPGKRALQP